MDEFTPMADLMNTNTDTYWELDGKSQYSFSRVVNYDIESGIESILASFIVENADKVSSYLRDNKELVEILQDGYAKLRDIVPNNKITLCHYSDYELDWQYLYITVLSEEAFEKRIEIERNIINDWILHIPKEYRRLLNFAVLNK